MTLLNMKKKLSIIIALVLLVFSGRLVFAQTAQELNDKIRELQQKVNDLKSQGDTLSSQIGAMDNQMTLTQYRISQTQKEITDVTLDIDSATKRMQNLEGSLNNVTKVLLNRIVATYQAGDATGAQVLLSSNDIADMISRANYLRMVQQHDKELLYETQQARNDYSHQKQILEEKKKKIEALNTQLQQYNKDLDSQKASKQQLLAQTQGDEAHYQRLLEQAQAQVRAFKSFATSSGGSSILPPQPSPDGWYYNQRDSRWGNNAIGSSPEAVWDVGCLLTSVAMVMKKHGSNVTPADIASNSSYFFSNTAYMNLPWGGGKFSVSWGNNQSAIDSKLASGEPVIVGVRGGAHFVVLKSGSAGHYVMNDPWYGPDLNFSDYYSSISQYGWYNG